MLNQEGNKSEIEKEISMYKLTSCPICGSDVLATGGCCGNPLVMVYKCPCAEKALEEQESKK